jgi:hypothetical protein
MTEKPDAAEQPAAPYPPPIDLAAGLSALHDQIDDLTTVADAQQRRLADLERQLRR